MQDYQRRSVRENPYGFGFSDPSGRTIFWKGRRDEPRPWADGQVGIILPSSLHHSVPSFLRYFETSRFPADGKGRSDAILTGRTVLSG